MEQFIQAVEFPLSVLAVIFALLSSWFWFKSSRVKFEFGYDNDESLKNSMSESSKNNSLGALFTACAALCGAFSLLVTALKHML